MWYKGILLSWNLIIKQIGAILVWTEIGPRNKQEEGNKRLAGRILKRKHDKSTERKNDKHKKETKAEQDGDNESIMRRSGSGLGKLCRRPGPGESASEQMSMMNFLLSLVWKTLMMTKQIAGGSTLIIIIGWWSEFQVQKFKFKFYY